MPTRLYYLVMRLLPMNSMSNCRKIRVSLLSKERKITYHAESHNDAIAKEVGMIKDIIIIADSAEINGKKYSRIYFDENKKQMFGT